MEQFCGWCGLNKWLTFFLVGVYIKMILCLGDSLTRGTVGFTYIKFVKKGEWKNKGKNGDTTYGALSRLKKYRQKNWYSSVDVCVVEIGTNDLLQPFLCGGSWFWGAFLKNRSWKQWALEPSKYEKLIRQILDCLLEDGKKVVLVGLPIIQLKEYPLDKLYERNKIVKRLANEYGAGFVDILRLEETRRPGCNREYKWGQTGIVRGLDIIVMFFFPFLKNLFSRVRKLELTVDGVHFNSFAAKLLAENLEREIERVRSA